MRTKLYTGKRCLQVMDEILDKTVWEWCLKLKNEIPLRNFNSVGSSKYPLEKDSRLNLTKMDKNTDDILNDFADELIKELKSEPNDDAIIKFVNKEITRIINKEKK